MPPAQNQRKGSNSGASRRRSKTKQKSGKALSGTAPWMCAICEGEVEEDEDVIECHKLWCHKDCTELSDAEYGVLARGGQSMLWQCNKCIREWAANRDAASRMEVKLDRMMKLFQDMIQRLEKLEGVQTGESIDDKIEEAVGKKVTELLDEKNEKEKWKLNLIVVNLPESNKPKHEERKREDRDRVRDIVQKITDVPGEEVNDPVRLGPVQIGRNVRPRLLKLVVRSEEAKIEIMRNVSRLNEGVEFAERVYINNDSTPRERANYRELKEEVQRRMEAGENGLIIRNLTIVKRKPRQMHQDQVQH